VLIDPSDPRESVLARRSRRGRRGGWSGLALRAGLAAAGLSRRYGVGGGSIIGGRVTMALDPQALRHLAAGRRVVLVTGTNGKTTTSHMLAAALRSLGPVAHNASGSNMADGALAALAEDPDAGWAVLEIDELHLSRVAQQVNPFAIVVLNLTRDQLDRAAEVRSTAVAIAQAVRAHPDTTVFANADDPMAVWAAHSAHNPVWVGAGSAWRHDTRGCPSCGHRLEESPTGWHCDCGLTRPPPSWWLDGDTAHGPDSSAQLHLGLPGQVNLANAVMALAVAALAGIHPNIAVTKIDGLDRVEGRFARIRHGRHTLRLVVLAKNPAGWSATMSMLKPDRPIVVVINNREADGRDTSWLWDVAFEHLAGRPVAACGQRAEDLGVRLSYADVAHHTRTDPLQALAQLPDGEIDIVANYTAFHDLRRRLDGPN
jgi:UDP-N-acetylmuramyl tripeptide synthase